MTREQKLSLIWRHTHRDYRGKIGGIGAILILREGGTHLVGMTHLTDTEIDQMLPFALKQEEKRKARKST